MVADIIFNGVTLGDHGVFYAPETADWHSWSETYKTIDKSNDSQHGGHWYGYSIEPKAFKLRCYFEDLQMHELDYVLSLFAPGNIGSLSFSERPWATYIVRVTKPFELMKYPSQNGTLSGTVVFYTTAYYPFATCDQQTIEAVQADRPQDLADMMNLTGIISNAQALAASNIPAAPITSQFTFLCNNAGNAMADTVLNIAGDVGTGVIIHNATTNQTCKIVKLTAANSTDMNRELRVDSKTGRTYLLDGATTINAYQYHESGFIQLAPSYPVKRSVAVTYNGTSITADTAVFDKTDAGKYVWLNGGWVKVTWYSSPTSLVVATPAATTDVYTADILRLNQITVTPVTTMSLTTFDLTYAGTFA